jgi:hypothetical protein
LVRKLRKDGMKLKRHELDSQLWIERGWKYRENHKRHS